MHTGQATILLQREGPQGQRGEQTEATGASDMANLDLFDKRGRFTAPSPDTLAALPDNERANVARVGDAAQTLDAATAAVTANESALADTRAEIVALEKVVPRQTFNDLAKAMCADTQRRRAGL
jgi:hypothetical protein